MSSAQETNFTAAQLRLITIVFKHLKACPEADWQAVAAEYGYEDGPLARSKFQLALSQCKKASGLPATPSKRNTTSKGDQSTPMKRKEVDTSIDATPTKRGRKTKGAQDRTMKEENREDSSTEVKPKESDPEIKEEVISEDELVV